MLPRKVTGLGFNGVVGFSRFNEAAAMLPRKAFQERGFHAATIGGFNEAAAMLPRKVTGSSKCRSGPTCFNEAAAMLPRKGGIESRLTALEGRFNEAAAMLPRKERRAD